MAADQLRKKWGTVFMGEREASEAQLDALQEPALRQRRRQQQEEDYLARVRARAESARGKFWGPPMPSVRRCWTSPRRSRGRRQGADP